MKILKNIALGMVVLLGLSACSKDYLDTEYTTYLGEKEAAKAAAANPDVFLNGMWSYMVAGFTASNTDHSNFGHMAAMIATDVMGEDIAFGSSHWFVYDYQLDYRMEHWMRTRHLWQLYYTMIAKANEVISLYPDGGSTVSEKGLVGQALAIRGMSYYYLVQLYQDYMNEDGTIKRDAPAVPIVYTSADGKTQEEIDAKMGRNTVGEVIDQSIADLEKAVSLLAAGYERPNKNYIDVTVANGLLARSYLLNQEWQKAADAANAARKGYTIMDNAGLHDGFMDINNAEWMWGFDHNTETTTTYASFFSHMSSTGPGYGGTVGCTKMIDVRLYNQIAATDYRKSLFVGPAGDASQPTASARKPYANLKFGWDGQWTMDYMYMRAAEMVLIEAEAYARLNNGTKAATVLKELMANRQPDWNKTLVSVDDVLLQRRIELWGEGFSYFDLKRNNLGINRNYDGTNHLAGCKLAVPAHDVLWTFQIPQSEIQENPMISDDDQNP